MTQNTINDWNFEEYEVLYKQDTNLLVTKGNV